MKELKEIALPLSVSCAECDKIKKECVGIVDTGATSTMISESIAEELNLEPCGKTSVSGVHNTEEANLYKIDICFGNDGYILRNYQVSGAKGNAGFDILIGMDILSCGEMLLSNRSGGTLFVFGVPCIYR